MLPITRDLFVTSDHNIDPPMSRLLAIHRACCLIMHLSGAGDYIDKVLMDMEDVNVRSDGTTELGSIISLRLHQGGEQSILYPQPGTVKVKRPRGNAQSVSSLHRLSQSKYN